MNNGIGTYKERTLHAALKRYYEADESKHEQKYLGYIADIRRGDEIIEIQTRSFNALRGKLKAFLCDNKVTVVYPVARTKWIMWLDTETGNITVKRRSPKTGKPYEAFYELYKIKQFLTEPNLKINIVMTDVEEYRRLDGWSKDKKKGSTRFERIPTGIGDIIKIDFPHDYKKLIPEALNETFDSKDFAKASGLSVSRAQTVLNVLSYVGAVERSGKKGNTYIYRRSGESEIDLSANPAM